MPVITQSRKLWFALALVVLFVLTNRSHKPSAGNSEIPFETSSQLQTKNSNDHPKQNLRPTAKTEPGSVEELALFVKSAGKTKSADEMFTEIGKMRLMQSSWWRCSTDFSDFLTLALDSTLSEDTRIVAIRLFLAGVPKEALQQQAEELQKSFSDSSDPLVSALLQDMADRKVAPKSLIRSTLADYSRGEHALCMAWYAARLTDASELDLSEIALRESKGRLGVVTKVAFDYLGAGDLSEQINHTPSLRRLVDEHLSVVMKLPASAEIIEMANADALIMAIPNLMDSERSKQVLLETIHNALNPEIRISALEQIVWRYTSREKDVESELAAIRKNLPTLFPDEVKQIRAAAILKRAESSPISQKHENE